MRTLTFIFVFANSAALLASEPVGPAYSAQKATELKKMQRAEKPQLTGPAYAAARQKWLMENQRRNPQGMTGPVYAAYTQRIKASQRLWNGTWPNNMYWPSYSNRIKGPYLSTPAFRTPSDPYLWGSQANSFWRY